MDNICLIGLSPSEVDWLRVVIGLLRHPDPVVGEVTREALGYLKGVAGRAHPPGASRPGPEFVARRAR